MTSGLPRQDEELALHFIHRCDCVDIACCARSPRGAPGTAESVAADLLMGVEAIAEHLGIKVRQVRYARETGSLPIRYKAGFGIYALKSELLDSLKGGDSLPPEKQG